MYTNEPTKNKETKRKKKIAHQDYIITSVIRKVCLCLPLNAINT